MNVEGLGVYEALLARSWAVRFDNPREMCHLARVAVDVAERLDPEVHGWREAMDFPSVGLGGAGQRLSGGGPAS